MESESYGREIRTIHQWEDYLDWLDTHVSIQGDNVVCKFRDEYRIPLANCKTPTKVLIEAFTLASWLNESEPSVHGSYLAKKFIELVRKPMKLPHDLTEMYEELYRAFTIIPKSNP